MNKISMMFPDFKLKAYTTSFDDGFYSDIQLVNLMKKYLNTNHRNIVLDTEDLVDSLEESSLEVLFDESSTIELDESSSILDDKSSTIEFEVLVSTDDELSCVTGLHPERVNVVINSNNNFLCDINSPAFLGYYTIINRQSLIY